MEPSLNLKLILLVRDPRGIMKSREKRDWCETSNFDCMNVSKLCQDLNDDYKTALALAQIIPKQVIVIR
jgi:hypothetical protein